MEPMIDPRGKWQRPQLKLAKRASLNELRHGPVLFYDNGKLATGNYAEILKRIKDNFSQQGINRFVDFSETTRGKTSKELKDLAAKLANFQPVAAVIALGDMGVSPATTVVVIALEELGIPSVYITAQPGHKLANATACYRAGRLCLCPIDIFQGSTTEEVREQTDVITPGITESLTLADDELSKRAALDFPVDTEPPSTDGLLGMKGKINPAEDLASGIEEITDYLFSLHIGDGLPVIPPTRKRYQRMLTYCPYHPETILASEIGPSGRNITVKDVAVGAVMAGAESRYMPILITALRALGNPRYNFLAGVTTSHPGGDLVLVSGPLAREIGIHGGQGCLGPGFKANMTIGRALNLTVTNVCRSVPGYADLACLSSQAEIAYCFAENPELTPWQTINDERYDDRTTTVLVLKAEPPHDVLDLLSQNALDLLDTFVDCCTTLGSNNAYIMGNLILVLTPDHARILSREGWNKNKIRQHIHTRVHNEVPMLRNRGVNAVRPEGFENRQPMPVTRSARDIEVVVAGGPGGHSAVILPWALNSQAIVERVLLPDGSIPFSAGDFTKKS
jgi:hypothetical protein